MGEQAGRSLSGSRCALTVGVAFAALIGVAACTSETETSVQTSLIGTGSVSSFATALLDTLQPQSIAGDREYCGYILRNRDGTLSSTPVSRGRKTFCDLPPPSPAVVASYHTHGGHDPDYNNEFPSSRDILTDVSDGIDGYVSTPAGRVWRVDHRRQRAVQVCGVSCVTADPDALQSST
ncbi:MAG: DUF4329 domain-containing protein, partial [Pseudomonadota bacterium]